MKIQTLTLVSFGKFQNKEIRFHDGFNILQGDNEVGKTTIHKFIEGMLFGFLDPTKSRRVYKEDHGKYQPKNASDYRGSMTIVLKDKTYRIERNFDKKQADVKVFDDQTGQDITDTLSIHPSLKLPDIGDFIGISYKLYQNTVSISQLLRKTEEDLGQALVERLHNITTTKDESISIAEIQQNLEKSLSEIGSEKAKTKPYAKAIQEVKNLEEEMEESKQKYKESERLFQEKKHKELEIKDKREDLREVKNHMHQYFNTKKKDQYHKATRIKDLMDQNTLKIEGNKESLALREEVYERLQQIQNEGTYLGQKQSDVEEAIKTLRKEKVKQETLLNQHPGFSSYQGNIYEVRDMFYLYKNQADELDLLRKEYEELTKKYQETTVNQELILDHKNVENLKQEKEELELYKIEQELFETEQSLRDLKMEAPSKLLLVIYYLLTIVLIGFFLVNMQKQKIQAHQGVLEETKQIVKDLEEERLLKTKQAQELSDKIQTIHQKHQINQTQEFAEKRRIEERKEQDKENYKKQIDDVKAKMNNLKEKHQEINQSLQNHFEQLQSKRPTSKEDFKVFEESFQVHRAALNKAQELGEELERAMKEFEDLSTTRDMLTKEFQTLIQKDHQSSMEEYKQGLKKKVELLQLQKENTQLLARMHDLTEGQALEDFKKSIDFTLTDYDSNQNIGELEQRQSNLRQELRSLESEAYELEKEISVIEKTYRDVYTLKAMKTKAEEELTLLKNEKASIELTSKVIDELAKEIQYEFAPSLNQAISEVMDQITEGKYQDLKMDQKTNVKMMDNYVKQLLTADDFSTGTIDQIYFSMRLGLSKILFEQDFPYIFDDTFVNYDANRLRNVLHLLETEDKQIILFTCHKREHLIAKEESILHHHQILQ